MTTLAQALPAPREFSIWAIEVANGWGDNDLILLTGFGPFGEITDNPSGRVAHLVAEKIRARCATQAAHLSSRVLPVRPGIIDEQDLKQYHTLISTGVDDSATAIRVETHARNLYRDPDTGESAPIDPQFPTDHTLSGGPLPPGITHAAGGFAITLGDETSAGSYVCNDTYYRACRAGVAAYFIHVPLIAPDRDEDLSTALAEVSCRILTFNWHQVPAA